MLVLALRQNIELESFPPVKMHINQRILLYKSRTHRKKYTELITRNIITLNARILGAGNRNSVSSSVNVRQAAKAAAHLPA